MQGGTPYKWGAEVTRLTPSRNTAHFEKEMLTKDDSRNAALVEGCLENPSNKGIRKRLFPTDLRIRLGAISDSWAGELL